MNIVLKGKKIAVLVVLEINRFYDFMCTIVIEGNSGYSSRVIRVCNVVHARTKRVHRRAVVVFCPAGYDLSVADYTYLLESIFRIDIKGIVVVSSSRTITSHVAYVLDKGFGNRC